MFNKILVANRGEIALRILRTLRELNIASVAVYSDIDRKSPFVYSADEAYALHGVTSGDSYLHHDKIINIARQSGAEAIHPGYGFLSENAAFAQQVAEAGLVFIGPPAESIRLMGNKTEARRLMQQSGVPTVPGTEDAVTDKKQALEIAREVGFPILVKAAAGGGGKGMRLVEKAADFYDALDGAAREAGSAFGDSSVYIEKYVEEPRHIEFQILADQQGRTIHLGERECSIQRRHQKIIEESPSVIMTPELRKAMGKAAIKAARACGYVNAGTIEFLVDKHRNFYFLEMNTRLQVEHPVTEMVTGMDLVKEQIRFAGGESLALQESVNSMHGHAIECRIYAENPEENFAPSPGAICHLKPADGPGIREDSGVAAGSEISLYYDPMISKLIAWDADRPQAISRMLRALREYEILGIQTTIPFLKRVLENEQFRTGNFTTDFIKENSENLFLESETIARIASMVAAVDLTRKKQHMHVNTDHDEQYRQRPNNQWKSRYRLQNLRKT